MRVVLLALLLAGCTTPHLTAANSSGGIVSSYGWQPNRSLEIAQEHCSKFGKDAVIQSENDAQDHMTFRCVSR